jgi:hypothetical protein
MSIVNLTTQQLIKPISPNWANYIKIVGGVTNFEQLTREVEQKELKTLFGNEFYFDFYYNQTEDKYITLINGTSFLNDNGNNLVFQGIKFMLAFMNFSKYVGESFVSDTFTGMVKKNRQESESLSTGDIKRLQQDAQELALQDFEIIKIYLEINKDIYPLWNRHQSKKAYIPKITGIKKTIN